MKETRNKEITINDLAKQMADGFVGMKKDSEDFAIAVAKGFDEVNEKFDKKFGQMDQKIDSVRLDLSKKIEDEIRSVKAEISFGISELKEEIKRLDARIDQLFKMTNEDISVVIDEMNKIKARVRKLELKNSQT